MLVIRQYKSRGRGAEKGWPRDNGVDCSQRTMRVEWTTDFRKRLQDHATRQNENRRFSDVARRGLIGGVKSQ